MRYLDKVLGFAFKAHEGQIRKGSKLPYIVHPMDVAKRVEVYFGSDEVLMAAAFLHDTIEDCGVSHSTINQEFGLSVADLVAELTSDEDEIKRLGKNTYLISEMSEMSQGAFSVKLCDRLSNISDLPRTKYVRDTLEMMIQLEEKREFITKEQEKVMREIRIVCLQFLVGLEG